MNKQSTKQLTPWTQDEITLLLRLHAEGKFNCEIYPQLQRHSPRAIDAKMLALFLDRNRMPERQNWTMGPIGHVEWPRDPWVVNIRFENVTKDEARKISAGSPKSGRFRKENIQRSIYGSSMAEMCG